MDNAVTEGIPENRPDFYVSLIDRGQKSLYVFLDPIRGI